ncbi:MAG: M28 family peptidase [Chloroflexota bacterium]|nr:M28 family peptidase [Chloroflexota bacterium]
MVRPPREPLGRPERRILLIFAAVVLLTAVLAVTAQLVLGPADPETPAVSPVPVVATSSPAAMTDPSSVPASPTAGVAGTPALPPASCDGPCLVRLGDSDGVRRALVDGGTTPNYSHDGQVWAALPAASIAGLRDRGVPVTIVQDDGDTLALYVVRAPEDMGLAEAAEIIGQAGEIVDTVGRQWVIRVDELPTPARGLVDRGIWVEKFPPTRARPPVPEAARETLPRIDDLDTLPGDVSAAELERTIRDLQGQSSTDGTGVGTRQYTTTGNVMASEYLYRRFAEMGINVWFEDFVTDDGLLSLNVVAELPGDDPADAYLVLGHYDSINDQSADQSEAPGADDNATGVAAMLEIARVLSQHRLAHPVRFFATNVEEVGLQGVEAFTRRLVEDGVVIAGAYNIDAVGSAAHGTQLVLNGDASSIWLQDILVDMNDRYGLGQALLVRQNPVIVADDNYLRDAGVPTILVARELFGWSTILHSPGDTIDTIDMDNVQDATTLVLLGVAALTQDA